MPKDALTGVSISFHKAMMSADPVLPLWNRTYGMANTAPRCICHEGCGKPYLQSTNDRGTVQKTIALLISVGHAQCQQMIRVFYGFHGSDEKRMRYTGSSTSQNTNDIVYLVVHKPRKCRETKVNEKDKISKLHDIEEPGWKSKKKLRMTMPATDRNYSKHFLIPSSSRWSSKKV